MKNASLISLSGYLPAKKISNKTSAKLVDYLITNTKLPKEYIDQITINNTLPGTIETNHDGWISQPWYQAWLDTLPAKKRDEPFQGAKERRRVPVDPESKSASIYQHPMLPSDAETIAGALAIVSANVKADDIDLVIVSSQVPDRALPANASLVQDKLGLHNAGAYAVDTCCSSFVTMLELAFSQVMCGMKKNILIISSYIDSHVTDRSDYFSVNTGDAAFAAIVTGNTDRLDYISSDSTSDGSRHDGIIFKKRRPGLLKTSGVGPVYEQEYTTFYNQQACKDIARSAEHDLKNVVTNTLGKVNRNVEDIDLLVTHQPVSWAAHAWRKAIGVDENKFIETFELYGNIANCCVPANFLEALEKGMVSKDDSVMLASSGAGENHISVLLSTSSQLIDNAGLRI